MRERINEKQFICVICPNSCRLTVWKDPTGEIQVTGNQCARGLDYGVKEYSHPERMLITTMQIQGAKLPVIPVRSRTTLPKELLLTAVKIISEQVCYAPIKMGDVLVENIADSGIDVIASRSMEEYQEKSLICEQFDENNVNEVIHHTLLNGFYAEKATLSHDEKIHIENIQLQLIERLKKFGLRKK